MIIRCMTMSLTIGLIAIGVLSVAGLSAGDAHAQSAWLGQGTAIPGLNGPASPIGGVTAPSPQAGGAQDQCSMDFQPLRDEADRRGELIKAASERHATPDEA